MNVTLKVKTLYDCDQINNYKATDGYDSLWMQTLYGCRLLQVLRDMYHFNMTYVIPDTQNLQSVEERGLTIYPQGNDSIDIYAKPISFSKQLLETANPIAAIFTWRYGFILKRPYTGVLSRFYSLPFTRPVWNCVYLLLIMVSGIFYYLSRWERQLLGGYTSYHYELLLAVGACCQHILPLQANMYSRRMAYLSYILCTYILYSFYTSNLLSHLVSDKDNSMDLDMLANSNYVCVRLTNLLVPIEHKEYKVIHQDTNLSIINNKLSTAKYMDLNDGLNAVMTTKTALLSDYTAVYPILIKTFATDEICQLIKIDLYSNIKKYFYTSKNFAYKEDFKIGILRARETGILQRLLLDAIQPPLNCAYTYPMSAEFVQIIVPLGILLGSCVVATGIMMLERYHFRTHRVWPYVN